LLLRDAWFAVAGMLATLPVARSTAAEFPAEWSSRLANRKERPPERAAFERANGLAKEGPVETWATLFNVHTGEAIPLSSSEPGFERFCDTLADRVTASRAAVDARLLELLRQIALKNPGARIELVSGYRSPKFNEMLRKKGHRVASHSQHSLGHAVDFRVIGLTPGELRSQLVRIGWGGGIGQYDGSGDLFVHADVGPKRAWYER
jgi:uncharacterized protein YcbK (DUF882 family)